MTKNNKISQILIDILKNKKPDAKFELIGVPAQIQEKIDFYSNVKFDDFNDETTKLGDELFSTIVKSNFDITPEVVAMMIKHLFNLEKKDPKDEYIFNVTNGIGERKDYGDCTHIINPEYININIYFDVIKEKSKDRTAMIYQIISTFYHELHHGEIALKLNDYGTFDFNDMQIALETIIGSYKSKLATETYYRKNYDLIVEEAAANHYATIKTREILKQHGIDDKRYHEDIKDIGKVNKAKMMNRHVGIYSRFDYALQKVSARLIDYKKFHFSRPILDIIYDNKGLPKDIDEIVFDYQREIEILSEDKYNIIEVDNYDVFEISENILVKKKIDSTIDLYSEIIYHLVKNGGFFKESNKEVVVESLLYVENKLLHNKRYLKALKYRNEYFDPKLGVQIDRSITKDYRNAVKIKEKLKKY